MLPEIKDNGILRDYQIKLKRGVFDAWRSGARDVCAVMPTGAGKTASSASIVKEFTAEELPTVISAHRQELVAQLSCAMAAEGVYHNIIASRSTVNLVSNFHVAKFGRAYYHPDAPSAVSSVDTIIRRDLGGYRDSVALYMTDECFPRWVEVGGVSIADIRVGDFVPAYNEASGVIEMREVVRTFKNPAPHLMVRLVTKRRHVVHCTPGHPVMTQRGWVQAADLNTTDMVVHYDNLLYLRGSRRTNTGRRKTRAGVLQPRVREGVQEANKLRDNGTYKQEVRLGANEKTQPDEKQRNARESVQDVKSYRPRSEITWRERAARNKSRGGVTRYAARCGLQAADNRADRRTWDRATVPRPLQDRLWERAFKNRGGSRRAKPLRTGTERARREEKRGTGFIGLDSVEIYEQRDLIRLGEGVCDGYVYNIEVEGLHTYVANGVVVHNCHHQAKAVKGGPNKWLKARQIFPNARGLGVTATPERSDGQGLGRHADGCFDVLVEGPTMRELIRRGYLTDYRIFCPPSDMDLSAVSVSAGGDYSRDGLKLASRKSSIVGDVVKEYIKIAAGKRGITFAVSVEDAEDIAQRFNDCGVPAVALSAGNTDKEREDAIEALRRGDILQIVNVDLLGEGVDIPAIEVVSFARPTQSYSLYIQMFGRALRPAEGKTHAIIIDHVGNVERFIAKGRGLPDSPQIWTLDRRERRARKDTDDIVINLTVCDECFAAYDKSLDCCPHCGAVPTPGAGVGRSAPEQVEGDLYEMPAELLAKLRGEADRLITESPEQTRDKMLAAGAPGVAAYGAAKNIRQRAESQHALRGVMAQWCNMWERLGIDRSSVQSMFYQAYGCDVLTAQTLGRSEADTLAGRIAADLKNYCA